MNSDEFWVIVDTETDGLYEPIHVVEIAAQRMRGWEPDGRPFQVFLDHDVPIPAGAEAIHGYTQQFLRKNGQRPKKAHALFAQYVGRLPIVAHNIGFDWNRALVPEWERLGIAQIGSRGFCSMTLSRRVIGETPNYKLETLKDYFNLDSGTSHRALNDVVTVVRLFSGVMGPRLDTLGLESFSDVAAFSKKTPIARCLSLVQGH